MATTIDVNSTLSLSDTSKGNCRYIPCRIHFDGKAKVSDFFQKTICDESSNGNKELAATFRGRPLNGVEVNLPSGFTGLVLKEHHKRTTEDEERKLIATHSFDKFTHWNLDKQPTSDDLIQRALQWVDISSALHKPVKMDSDQSSSQTSMKGH
ncbi:ribonuclease H2 subunit C-like [Physella acuta]|uniref:ribonuclease H2 subunit C-like n=1 Tax=Physella acuta TaxID=109671 RepID=UPI0027DE147E|nr:ribonuclease H2 subunit C-like [Physella acuta]